MVFRDRSTLAFGCRLAICIRGLWLPLHNGGVGTAGTVVMATSGHNAVSMR